MRQKYEILTFTPEIPVRCSIQKLGILEPHMHDFFEVVMILAGSCRIQVGDRYFLLREEDIIAFNCHTTHALWGTDCVLVSVQFDQTMYEKPLPHPFRPLFDCNSAVQGNLPAYDSLRKKIAELVKNNSERADGFELRNQSLIYGLMEIFYLYFRADSSMVQAGAQHRYADRMAQINRILSERYMEPWTLAGLADEVHLSVPYLSRFFEQQYGMNYLAYLTEIRLDHAVRDLLGTDHTIEQVSADNGFPNSHAFVRAFKNHYDVLPSTFRRSNRPDAGRKKEESTEPETFAYTARLKKYLEKPEAETLPEETNSCLIRVPADAEGTALRHTWKSVMPGGNAIGLLFAEIQEEVRRMQREVGFTYIHFHGIFSDEMRVCHLNHEKKVRFSFLSVDRLLDFLLGVGLKPVVEFSFMPTLLAKYPGKKFVGYCTSEPEQLSEWGRLIRAFLEHILARYGEREVESWIFTLWNAPNSSENVFGFSTDEAFFGFYLETYRAMRECDPRLKMGSPSAHYVYKNNDWMGRFLAWCGEHDCAPDFLCYHYYDIQMNTDAADAQALFGFPGQMTLMETEDGMNDFVRYVRSRYPIDTIHLLEWNNTPSQQDWLNDTCFKSCYLVRGILQNYDVLDSFCYWSLSDWLGENATPMELFSGGNGLFTVNGIPKPAFYALTLLKRLGNVRIGKGEGWFATRSESGYQVLLYNYRHYSHLYSLGERFDMTFTDRYTPFSPERSMDVHMVLEHVPDGEYRVREVTVGRKAGSAFDEWVRMGAYELEDEEEMRNLEDRSRPSVSKYRVKAENGVLELDAMLAMLEVRLLVIEPRDRRVM